MDTNSAQTPQTLTQQVAALIRVELAYQRMRQSQLARKIGVTEQWLSVRVRGIQPIDLNDLATIAAGLEVPVTRLLPETADVVAPLVGAEDRSQPMRSRRTHAARRDTNPLATHEYGRVAERVSGSVTRPGHGPGNRKPRDARPKGRVDSVAPAPTLRRPVRVGVQ